MVLSGLWCSESHVGCAVQSLWEVGRGPWGLREGHGVPQVVRPQDALLCSGLGQGHMHPASVLLCPTDPVAAGPRFLTA